MFILPITQGKCSMTQKQNLQKRLLNAKVETAYYERLIRETFNGDSQNGSLGNLIFMRDMAYDDVRHYRLRLINLGSSVKLGGLN